MSAPTFRAIHERILRSLEFEDGGKPFEVDAWSRPAIDGKLAGEGSTCVLEGGDVFERAGVNFSDVSGSALPPSASQKHPAAAGRAFRAVGVSVVCHPRNPWVPTSHFNVRMLQAGDIGWFGGGFDLTPYLPIEDDAKHWHAQAKAACDTLSPSAYPDFKQRCDEYFYIPHRDEARGIGGVFFDDLDATSAPIAASAEQCLAFVSRLAEAYLGAYLPIVKRRKSTPFTDGQREFQLYRRGRYVEFNLVIDRGTHFGLQSKGRIDSILVSMPPLAKWSYRSPDAKLEEAIRAFIKPRAWVE
jgi:coproporphyrinogen III oxidase